MPDIDDVSLYDPRTMPPDDLLDMTEQVYGQISRAWLWLADSFTRIQRDKLYTRRDCPSFEKYLEARFHGLAMSTVKQMLLAKRYVEKTEPKHVAASRLGPIAAESLGAPNEQVSALPSYTAVVKLNALKNKAAAGAVPQEDYDNLHRQAFAGEITHEEVRRQAHKLSNGIRLVSSAPKGDPDQDKVRAVEQQIAVAAAGVRSLKPIIQQRRADPRVLANSVVRLLRALWQVIGADAFRRAVAEVERLEADEEAKEAAPDGARRIA